MRRQHLDVSSVYATTPSGLPHGDADRMRAVILRDRVVRGWRAGLLGALVWLLACLPAWAQQLEIAELPPDLSPSPAQVVGGGFDRQFVPLPPAGSYTLLPGAQARWWRITIHGDGLDHVDAHLRLSGAMYMEYELWRPGAHEPIRLARYGAPGVLPVTERSVAWDIDSDWPPGQPVYLRIPTDSRSTVTLRMEGSQRYYRNEIDHAYLRGASLAILLLSGLLALLFFLGTGQRHLLRLGFVPLTAAVYMAATGGEARVLPLFADNMSNAYRLSSISSMLMVAGILGFVRSYLGTATSVPRLDVGLRVMFWLVLALALAAAVLPHPRPVLSPLGNSVSIACVLLIFITTLVHIFFRQRRPEGILILLCWLPLLVTSLLLPLQRGFGKLLPYDLGWVIQAWPLTMALAAFALTIGSSRILFDLRRDRDHAAAQVKTDALTGAVSRAGIDTMLDELVEHAQRDGRMLSVAFIDLDHFKQINDIHGHHVGDECLRHVTRLLQSHTRRVDVLGRYGGDEMVLLMPDTNLHGGGEITERLRMAVTAAPMEIDGQRIALGLSIGVAQWSLGETAKQLLGRADGALYASKQAGRNRVSLAIDPVSSGTMPQFVNLADDQPPAL